MAKRAAFTVDILGGHREYNFLDPRTELFNEKQKRQGWAWVRDLIKGVATEFAEADSLIAFERWQVHPEEFPEGMYVVVFIGKDGAWVVDRCGGRLDRRGYDLKGKKVGVLSLLLVSASSFWTLWTSLRPGGVASLSSDLGRGRFVFLEKISISIYNI